MSTQAAVSQEPDVVTVERKDGIAIVRINRPKALNALNEHVMASLARAWQALEADASIFGVIVTGGGEKAFVAGADISEMAKYGPVEASRMARAGQRTLGLIENSSKVVIAAVNGYALGGGCELAMACDFIVASETAKLGQPEVTIGVIPGFAGTQRLARLVGTARAKELVLTGRQIDAQEALRIGLAARVVPGAELLAECEKILRSIQKNAPVAVRLAKDVINRGVQVDLEAASQMEADAFAICFSTADQKEGMKAFLEKRKPSWKGQ
jgi:enoyl-CoA hydratase